jgi:hypothetical protein
MRRSRLIAWTGMLLRLVAIWPAQSAPQSNVGPPYLGFDRNDFPGDAALPELRKTFSYTSYWLNNPPGEMTNSWAGKRAILKQNGFGFLVLFTGRTDAEIKAAAATGGIARQLGLQDGQAAVAAAAREGFPKDVLIFLDQEEGGRLLPEQVAYLFGWIDAVRDGGARPGVYCSGIEVSEGNATISTARDITQRELLIRSCQDMPKGSEVCIGSNEKPDQHLTLWIANDSCPPAPGCTMTAAPRLESAIPEALRPFATVWQYAQSPRRAQFSGSCPQNQAPDGNCYAQGSGKIFVDLDAADAADPSEDSH